MTPRLVGRCSGVISQPRADGARKPWQAIHLGEETPNSNDWCSTVG